MPTNMCLDGGHSPPYGKYAKYEETVYWKALEITRIFTSLRLDSGTPCRNDEGGAADFTT